MARFLLHKKIAAAIKWRGKRFKNIVGIIKYRSPSAKPTALRGIRKFGKLFLVSFPEKDYPIQGGERFVVCIAHSNYESAVSLAVKKCSAGTESECQMASGQVKLGFEKRSVVIEAIQGMADEKETLDVFSGLVGMPWANFLVLQVEEQARKTGFTHVKIRKPEGLFWYRSPNVISFGADGKKKTPEQMEEDQQKIRIRMRGKYKAIAKRLGYAPAGDFFVKAL